MNSLSAAQAEGIATMLREKPVPSLLWLLKRLQTTNPQSPVIRLVQQELNGRL